MELQQYFDEQRSEAGSYALGGFALAFVVLFPFTLFLAGPAVGVPMGLYESFLFALSAAGLFGVVSGAVAGASEAARREPASAEQLAEVKEIGAQVTAEAA